MKIQKVKNTDGNGIGKTLGYVTFWFMVGFIPSILLTMIIGLLAYIHEQNTDK